MNLKLITKEGYGILGYKEGIIFLDNNGGVIYFDGVNQVNKNQETYLSVKFGKNYSIILPNLEDETEAVCNYREGKILSCGFRESVLKLFDSQGKLIQSWEMPTLDGIYDICIDNLGYLWYIVPTYNQLCKYDLQANRVVFICETGLDFPESLFLRGNTLYICNMGMKNLLKLDTVTQEMGIDLEFQESIWEYINTGKSEYARVGSGIYEIHR